VAGLAPFPVECVGIEEAREFCRRLSALRGEKKLTGAAYRLSTEAEWEYACRAGAPPSQPFACGSSLSESQANINGSGVHGELLQRPTPVGSYAPNAFGLYDMHGNCWDWCGDRYARGYYARSPREDPLGPAKGRRCLLRGGSWFNAAHYCRCARRLSTTASGSYCIGFRVVLPVGRRKLS
jgi:formylglycine-generating enzyme required for sulfatase activity